MTDIDPVDKPVAPTPEATPTVIPPEEQESLVGETGPGQTGYIALDDAGAPSGPATLIQPDGPSAAVVNVTAAGNEDLLTTPSGAPITSVMNPAHSFRDAGMEERNPTPDPLTQEQLDALDYKPGGAQTNSPASTPAGEGAESLPTL